MEDFDKGFDRQLIEVLMAHGMERLDGGFDLKLDGGFDERFDGWRI